MVCNNSSDQFLSRPCLATRFSTLTEAVHWVQIGLHTDWFVPLSVVMYTLIPVCLGLKNYQLVKQCTIAMLRLRFERPSTESLFPKVLMCGRSLINIYKCMLFTISMFVSSASRD